MMPRHATPACIRRILAPVITYCITLVMVVTAVTASAASAADIDRDRAAASRALAQRYWREAGLDALPQRYDRTRFEKALGGEDDPYNIVAAIAVATLTSNPERKESVLRYLNEALLPYARSHKDQYVCLVSEVFYNSSSSTGELQGLAKASHTSEGVAVAFIAYAYFLIKTERERDKLGLVVPANSGIPESVNTFKQTLSQDGGALVTKDAVRLNCSH